MARTDRTMEDVCLPVKRLYCYSDTAWLSVRSHVNTWCLCLLCSNCFLFRLFRPWQLPGQSTPPDVSGAHVSVQFHSHSVVIAVVLASLFKWQRERRGEGRGAFTVRPGRTVGGAQRVRAAVSHWMKLLGGVVLYWNMCCVQTLRGKIKIRKMPQIAYFIHFGLM